MLNVSKLLGFLSVWWIEGNGVFIFSWGSVIIVLRYILYWEV